MSTFQGPTQIHTTKAQMEKPIVKLSKPFFPMKTTTNKEQETIETIHTDNHSSSKGR